YDDAPSAGRWAARSIINKEFAMNRRLQVLSLVILGSLCAWLTAVGAETPATKPDDMRLTPDAPSTQPVEVRPGVMIKVEHLGQPVPFTINRLVPPNTLTDAEKRAGWKLLFDGKTTDGWRGYKKDKIPDGWKVVDGTLSRVAKAGDIVTTEQFD